MTSYEIKYFNIHARSLVSKIILERSGASYVVTVPEWPREKADMPYGRLPVLIESSDGENFVLSESRAIEEYLAGKFGYLPAGIKDLAVCNEYVCQIYEIIEAVCELANYIIITSYTLGPLIDGLTKSPDQCVDRSQFYIAQRIADMRNSAVSISDHFLAKHESILSKSKSGFYFGNCMTYPDILLFAALEFLKSRNVSASFNRTKYPNVMNLIDKVGSDKAVADIVSVKLVNLF
ncbi:Glutathione S-transferase 4 [Smittium culicis]|uniref:Glutathione S-transferase 4 n=1 Tax=Smittium culicis TaxID=133412 RepID=A0A1R1X457_9FUNG|nr:Glutathione S-transferase 4 [Smittium culicis]